MLAPHVRRLHARAQNVHHADLLQVQTTSGTLEISWRAGKLGAAATATAAAAVAAADTGKCA